MSAHTADTELTLVGKLILEGELHCETGLHIGAGKGSLEIGGADNPVVKDAFGRPYVPGSSLRGKLRARLAYTIARHSLRSLDTLEKLLLQVTRKNDPRGYERFRDLFEAIVAYNE